MISDELITEMVEQLGYIVTAARERFTDALETYIQDKKEDAICFTIDDNYNIEQMFSEAFNTYIVAEAAAILSYVIYDALKKEEIVKQIVPAFLDLYEKKMDRIPEILVKKTSSLPELAKSVLDAKTNNNSISSHLLKDITNMSDMNNLRVSFNAAFLNFLGE